VPDSEATKTHLQSSVEIMKSDDLLIATQELAARACVVEADLVAHLAEIDARDLYRQRAFSSMFSFCVGELGFSGDVAYNRILVARAGRRWPAVMDALRLRRVHLAGLRLLAPHLTDENHGELLAQADGKSKRKIEELVARIAPRPPVPTSIRQVPDPSAAQARTIVEPLSEATFRIEFTGSRALRDKLCLAQDLLQHRVPNRDLGTVIEKAVDLLLEKVNKERLALVDRPRKKLEETSILATSRYIPAAVRRAVVTRDGSRCTFVDETSGRRCEESSGLEFDHVEGYARTKRHDPRFIRLLCGPHHRLVTEKTYGPAFAQRGYMVRDERLSRPGTGTYPGLLQATVYR
jgi:hypothetical protein